MKRIIGLSIGLSMVLTAPAYAHKWVQVGKGYDQSVTEIDIASVERNSIQASFIARTVLPYEDSNGIQVYAFEYQVMCSIPTYEVVVAAGFDRDGEFVFHNRKRQPSQYIMNNSMMARLRAIACRR
jgi:hypothetical protein